LSSAFFPLSEKYSTSSLLIETRALAAKGRGAKFALDLLAKQDEATQKGITLTLLTLPFVYSNFLGFFTPLPAVESSSNNNTSNQWQINASLGDGEKPLDMLSVTDLSIIVRKSWQ